MKILIVDDNPETLQLMSILLSSRAECITCNNGKEAIQHFETAHEQNAPFQLIFLDIMMPEMDGHAVLKAIRELESEKFPPEKRAKIAMLTALGTPKSRFASYEEGCEYYLVKPIIKADLLDIVDKTEEWFELFI